MIETPEGKAEYVAAQRDFAARSQVLRHRLVEACDGLLADHVYALAATPGGDVWAGTRRGVARIARTASPARK